MYQADDCPLIADIRMRRLRSTDMAMCAVWWYHTSDRWTTTAGPHDVSKQHRSANW